MSSPNPINAIMICGRDFTSKRTVGPAGSAEVAHMVSAMHLAGTSARVAVAAETQAPGAPDPNAAR